MEIIFHVKNNRLKGLMETKEKATDHHISSFLGNTIAPSLVLVFTVQSCPVMQGVLQSSQMILLWSCVLESEKVTTFEHYIITSVKIRKKSYWISKCTNQRTCIHIRSKLGLGETHQEESALEAEIRKLQLQTPIHQMFLATIRSQEESVDKSFCPAWSTNLVPKKQSDF